MSTRSGEQLLLKRVLKDGRVLAVNVWRTGWQQLVYPSRKAFEAAKIQVEQEGRVPDPIGYAAID